MNPVQANPVNHEKVSMDGKLAFMIGDSFEVSMVGDDSDPCSSEAGRWYSGRDSEKK